MREIRRRTRRKFAPEEKVRIVLEGLRGEQSISELCRREGIAANLYYRWSKDFREAGNRGVKRTQGACRPCDPEVAESGVLEEGELSYPESGTPQGGGISADSPDEASS